MAERSSGGVGMTRADFLKAAFFSGVYASGAMRPFRAAAGIFSEGTPELVFGILSDVHVRMSRRRGKDIFDGEEMLARAFGHFGKIGVDGVVICGDLADCGLREELNAIGRCWLAAFPDNKARDGRHVEKLFVYGNHDWEGYSYGNAAEKLFGKEGFDHTIRKDLSAAWPEAFHEEYEPIWRKEVKGYTFIGAHWIADRCRGSGEVGVPQAAPWFAANGETLDRSKPFFYLQHPSLKGTCHGEWVWGQGAGDVTAALSRFPNAIAFSGHTHASINDDRAIWQGTLTSIGCGSLKYTGLEYGDVAPFGRENDNPSPGQRAEDPYKIMQRMGTSDGHQGMVVRVYRDRIVFSRMDFESQASLGNDWIVPLSSTLPVAPADRAAQSVAPEFPVGAALKVRMTRGKNRGGEGVRSEEQDVLEVEIPAAIGPGSARALDYAVAVCGTDGTRDERFVFAEGFYRAATSGRARSPTVCRLAMRRLRARAQGALTVEVRPRNCFGKAGAPISATFKKPCEDGAI